MTYKIISVIDFKIFVNVYLQNLTQPFSSCSSQQMEMIEMIDPFLQKHKWHDKKVQ